MLRLSFRLLCLHVHFGDRRQTKELLQHGLVAEHDHDEEEASDDLSEDGVPDPRVS